MYKLKTVTRIQEGTSWEDIENGDAYETAYLVYDENGKIIVDTTDEDYARSYIDVVWKQYITYLGEWVLTHQDKKFYGMSPVSFYEWYDNEFDDEDEYVPSATNGDYSPSNPWNAPGMSIRDFI